MIAFALVLGGLAVYAQIAAKPETEVTQPAKLAHPPTTETTEPAQPEESRPAVAAVVSIENANGRDKDAARLTNRILVRVKNLDQWLEAKESTGPVILYLDDRPLPGTKGDFRGPAVNSERVVAFDLIPTDEESQEWRRVLVAARDNGEHRIHLSVGLPGGQSVLSERSIQLLRPKQGYQLAVYAGLGAFVIFLFLLAKRSDLIRTGPVPGGRDRRKFGLGQTQMAIWFSLIVISWTYISLMTSTPAHISQGLLVLMGISGATGLAAAAINNMPEGAKVISERAAQPRSRIQWITDILSDQDGISFHRFQIFIWTLVFGIYFVIRAFRDYAMPELDASMLTLMGISSGTYVAFKFSEVNNRRATT